jgi:predicted lysophospholipase L1 biosynthesis ABC-type transport system permease subunit
VQTGTREVSAGYFRALGQRILEGREFGAGDTAASQRVVIVNAEFARRYLDGRALGWTVGAGADAALIVGVAADTVRSSVLDVAQPELFRPAAQAPVHASTVHLLVRSRSDPLRLAPTVRSIVREAAPGVPIDSIGTMEDLVSGSLSRPRLYALVLGVFAAFALLIAGVGLFGVLSYAVAQRAREIGIRAALGAQMRDIVVLVAGQSATIAGAGVALGLVASLGLGGLLRTLLYGVAPYDAFSFAAVAALLVVVATLASVVPARRAATIDPVRVLRG